MARHTGTVLVDTNVIIEAHRIDAWRALSGGYSIETVDDCVTETQTGRQRRNPEQQIDEVALRLSLSKVHDVTDLERAQVALKAEGIALDRGEHSLWAHTDHHSQGWVLCGPDKASLRLGVRLGYREQLVSLEELLIAVGDAHVGALKHAYTTVWLNKTLSEIVISEMGRPK
tara:strand:+ start:33701 stop:34216 length:516 start_codon:yes stop_codon:yes gene_type:complete